MRIIKIGLPILMIAVSLVFLISSFQIPKATLGSANGPLYFPIGISALMLILSVIYLVNELRNIHEKEEKLTDVFSKRAIQLIVVTIILGIIYALTFETLGFLISTILFLGVLLFYLNGWRKWLVNVIVTVSFSFITWYGFSQLLGVSLP
ncbi:tripartite tricarboxylate transporter TctB family protein [Cytobacillus sp. FSL W7-1323]|uniref:Tripartite tricarboxylate transporter TctB family protein n=1 Tax=Cytobacillus kochii TaxID=859143 RepID=A0A248TFG6_9BACI|nr:MULTISPECIES: tripartite tricarboxylate transporter TctB family protein [Cytobacillus]ASV66862.1 tripartite tricarboxylate transporter TctB family protein [Cytobacillus kochii]MCA1024591.1 tripartite tricarboxylate transporter TctB family protein [Cytobacillus kochii]MCM3323414.1 tripartite tricarboxylate transporter TctB family protein [Cytobacillus kochii]MCM3345809.1 tripartite tricarboxylate transporter TctB family protein [Cytobacillus kochii]MDM5206274.1 tripartite tricarboxylate tran